MKENHSLWLSHGLDLQKHNMVLLVDSVVWETVGATSHQSSRIF